MGVRDHRQRVGRTRALGIRPVLGGAVGAARGAHVVLAKARTEKHKPDLWTAIFLLLGLALVAALVAFPELSWLTGR